MRAKKIVLIIASVIGLIILGFVGLVIAMKQDAFPSQYTEIPVTIESKETTDSYFKNNNNNQEINKLKKIFHDLPYKLKGWTKKGATNGGEIFIAKGDTIIHHSSVGFKDTDDGEKYELNTICRIRSMTKPMIGTLVLQLIEEKQLKLSDKVSKYLKSFSGECTSKVTIKDLLYHTSGFNVKNTLQFKNLKSGVDSIATKCLDFSSNKKFNYSDYNTATLARVIEEILEKPIEIILKEALFEPLQLKNTYTQINDSFRKKLSSTHLYDPVVGVKKYWDNNDKNFVSFFRASGGVFSTPRDYAVFCNTWMKDGVFKEKKILTKNTIDKSLIPNKLSIKSKKNYFGYGLHWQIFEKKESDYGIVYGHGGSDGTLALIIPKYNLTICFFTQTRKGKALKLFYRTIFQKLKKINL